MSSLGYSSGRSNGFALALAGVGTVAGAALRGAAGAAGRALATGAALLEAYTECLGRALGCIEIAGAVWVGRAAAGTGMAIDGGLTGGGCGAAGRGSFFGCAAVAGTETEGRGFALAALDSEGATPINRYSEKTFNQFMCIYMWSKVKILYRKTIKSQVIKEVANHLETLSFPLIL